MLTITAKRATDQLSGTINVIITFALAQICKILKADRKTQNVFAF